MGPQDNRLDIEPYHTLPYHTIPYHTIPYHTLPYHTIPYHTIPYHTMPPYHTVPYRTTVTVPYHRYRTVPPVPYRTTGTVPYRTVTYLTEPHRVQRLAMATFWPTCHHEVKISPGWWGWGVHANPVSLYLHIQS